MYFLVYSTITLSIAVPISLINLKSINQINLIPSSPINKIAILLNLLSLGGLPPFLGVAPRILVISIILTKHHSSFFISLLAIILVSSSIVTLFFYIKVFISSRPLYSQSPNNLSLIKNSFLASLLSSTSLIGNI